MATTYRRRRSGYRRPRRKVVFARAATTTAAIATGTTIITDLLAPWVAEMGLTAPFPGTTLTSIRIRERVSWTTSSAGVNDHEVAYGIIVGPLSLDPADLDPRPGAGLQSHLPWLSWGDMFTNSGAGTGVFPFGSDADVSLGRGPYSLIKAKRKLDNIGETVWLVNRVQQPAGTAEIAFFSSCALMLP